jgi:hypothetical protein
VRLFFKAPILLCLLFYCSMEPKVDTKLYGTWMVIGIKSVINGYGTVEEKGYSVDNSLVCYKISSDKFTYFIRGIDHSLSLMGGDIEFYDSTSVEPYSATIDENTISFDKFSLLYSIRNICGTTLLKISRNATGYDPYAGAISETFSQYCIKVNKDSLPFSWPSKSDVALPDSNSNCTIYDLDSW